MTEYRPDDVGIREVPLLKSKALPVGYVAYCHPCGWSTGICVGMSSDSTGRDRAKTKLDNHKKSRAHVHVMRKR